MSEDGHSALVDFEITGDALEAADRLDPSQDAVAAVQDDHPDLLVEQFGSVSSNKELRRSSPTDLLKAETLSLPITLMILIVAFGSLVAALVPLLIGVTSVMAALGLVALPSQLSPVDSNLSSVILLIGLAVGVDYSLFYLRREREERAAGPYERDGARDRRGDLGARRPDLRPHGDRRDGGHVLHRRQDLPLVRRGHDPRGRDRDVRVAHRAARRSSRGSATASRRGASRSSAGAARRPAQSRFWSAVGGRGHAAALAVDRARRRSPGRAGDPRSEHEDRGHERRRPAAGPAGDQDLQPASGRVPQGGRHRGRGRRGRERAHGQVAAAHRSCCSSSAETRERASPGTEVTYSEDGKVALDLDPDRAGMATTRSRRCAGRRSGDDVDPGDDRRGDGRDGRTSAATPRSRRTSGTWSTAAFR